MIISALLLTLSLHSGQASTWGEPAVDNFLYSYESGTGKFELERDHQRGTIKRMRDRSPGATSVALEVLSDFIRKNPRSQYGVIEVIRSAKYWLVDMFGRTKPNPRHPETIVFPDGWHLCFRVSGSNIRSISRWELLGEPY